MQRARLVAKLASRVARQRSSTCQCSQPLTALVGRNEATVCNAWNQKDAGIQSFHTFSRNSGGALLQTEELTEGIVFPRETRGLSYAQNWALAAAGVTPFGKVYRNLKPGALVEVGAEPPEARTGTPVFVKGSEHLSKTRFNQLFKEVTTYLSTKDYLYVHDGAVGSAPSSEARTRTICDSPSRALALSEILTPAPTRSVASRSFPVTVYVTNYNVSANKNGYIVVDYDTSAVLVLGEAVGDVAAIKSALAAVAAPISFEAGALPLPGRLVAKGDDSVLVIAPGSLDKLVAPSSDWPDAGVVWNKKGVARLFKTESATAPNLYKAPSSVVLLTKGSDGAKPSLSKITPPEAVEPFVEVFEAEGLKPAAVEAKPLAEKLTEMLGSTHVPIFTINASQGLSAKELDKLLDGAVSQKAAKSKAKK